MYMLGRTTSPFLYHHAEISIRSYRVQLRVLSFHLFSSSMYIGLKSRYIYQAMLAIKTGNGFVLQTYAPHLFIPH